MSVWKLTLRISVIVAALITPAFGQNPFLMVNENDTGFPLHQEFPSKTLRGYATVSANEYIDESGDSLLQITCQDPNHARLLQAKYLSDLGELPPATSQGEVVVRGVHISIQTAEGVGSIAALRQGTTVIIAAGRTPDALSKTISEGVVGDPTQWTSTAEGKVPMYLDRFDKYGFRFYYAPGSSKPLANGQVDPAYDPGQDFDFAKTTHGGILVWTGGQSGETAVGLTKRPAWNWALGEAKKKGVAFGINTGIDGDVSWYFNRYPDSVMQFAPDFLGDYYGSMNFGFPMVAWSNPMGQDAMLQQLQSTIRDLRDTDSITSWLEPHEELGGGIADLLVEYGPTADKNFQNFLRDKYKSVSAVSQRWFGNTTSVASWQEIHVPEPASFLGWGPNAIDLAGTWKVSYEEAANPSAAATNFDDSGWGEMVGPGDGLARKLPQQPALWRRHLTIGGAWLEKHSHVWLYVFDLNNTVGADKDLSKAVVASVNGKTVPENPLILDHDHWSAVDVTNAIHEGDNVFAIHLPSGIFNYRAYLSGDEPKSYPALGEGKNARWVDYIAWVSNLRKTNIHRGMQMIRQADPDRGIMLMAPDSYEDDILQDAMDYGGDFHNTGYLAGWWSDREPAAMRGAGLPFSTEPGGGPTKATDVLGSFGNWITAGVNAIDHFQNLGEVLWNPEVKKCFEDHAKMYTSVGRYHCPTAQVAAIYSNRVPNLFGFPFTGHMSSDDGQSYFRGCGNPSTFDCRTWFSPVYQMTTNNPLYESDAVKEISLVKNLVSKYRVIVDTDTAVLDEDTIDGIDRYVRSGGIFITNGDTGRHSPEKPDTWPMDRLTGFHIVAPKPDNGAVSVAPNQPVLPTDWQLVAMDANNKVGMGYGYRLKAYAPDASALMNWSDGQTAVGMRPLGKGYIVTVGLTLWGAQGPDLFAHLLKWAKLVPIPAHLETADKDVFWRHFLSNNGLYDVWVVRNYKTEPVTNNLILADGYRPSWLVDLNSGQRISISDGRVPVNVAPLDMSIYTTPRPTIASSASEWFELQRGWWQGTGDKGPPFAEPDMKLTVNLTQNWLFQDVDAGQKDVSSLVDPHANDSSWEKMPLGIFTLPDHPDVRHFVVRRHFHVPESWNHGRTLIRLPDDQADLSEYIDGKLYNTYTMPDPLLAAGSDHVVAFECQASGPLMGTQIGAQTSAWLTYHPDPVSKQSLAGNWQTSPDYLKWSGSAAIPGQIPPEVKTLRTTFRLDPAAAGKTIVVHAMERTRGLRGCVINGHYVCPAARESAELNVNVTPWVKPGEDTQLVLLGGGGETVIEVSIEFHITETYP